MSQYTGTIHIENIDLDLVRKLQTILGKDRRDLVKQGVISNGDVFALGYTYHCDLQLNEDMTGLEWNGAEKSHGLDAWLNLLVQKFQITYTEGDTLRSTEHLIRIENGLAQQRKASSVNPIVGTRVFAVIGFHYDDFELCGVFANAAEARNHAEYLDKLDRLNHQVLEMPIR